MYLLFLPASPTHRSCGCHSSLHTGEHVASRVLNYPSEGCVAFILKFTANPHGSLTLTHSAVFWLLPCMTKCRARERTGCRKRHFWCPQQLLPQSKGDGQYTPFFCSFFSACPLSPFLPSSPLAL